MKQDSVALKSLEALELFLYKNSNRIVTLTEAFRSDLIRRGISPAKVVTIRNGVDLTRFHPSPRDRNLEEKLQLKDKWVVGYIGTIGMAHALENVIEAASLLRSERKIQFLILGSGAGSDLLEKTKHRLAAHNVVLIPRVPKEEVIKYWSLVDLALVHLKNDPVFSTVIPSKMFEAMGCGKPVLLAAPEGEAAQVLRPTGAGRIIPSENPGLLAETLRDLMNNPHELEKMKIASLNSAGSFSREEQARRFLEALP